MSTWGEQSHSGGKGGCQQLNSYIPAKTRGGDQFGAPFPFQKRMEGREENLLKRLNPCMSWETHNQRISFCPILSFPFFPLFSNRQNKENSPSLSSFPSSLPHFCSFLSPFPP